MSAPPEEPGTATATAVGDRAYPESQVSHAGGTYWLERSADGAKRLVAIVAEESAVRAFAGSVEAVDGGFRLVAETTSENARALRSALPWLTPSRFGLHTSAGFGDRLGLATPGHVRALREVGAAINPVFAQQSIREMGRCGRTPSDVLDDATWGAFQAGWTNPVGGDADHLEALEDIDSTVAAGFVFYTLDPKAEVDGEAEHARRGDDPAEGSRARLGRSRLRPGDLHPGVRRPTAGPGERRCRAGRGVGAAGHGQVRPLAGPRDGHVPAPDGEGHRLRGGVRGRRDGLPDDAGRAHRGGP